MITVIAAAISFVSSAVGTIATAVIKIVPMVMKAMNIICKLPWKEILQVGDTLFNVGKSLGLLPADKDVQALGERTLQAQEAGLSPQDCKDFDEYMQKLKDFQVDPEKRHDEQEQIQAGALLACSSLEHRYHTSFAPMIEQIARRPEHFNPDRLQHLLERKSDLDAVGNYYQNRLAGEERRAVEAELIEAERSRCPQGFSAEAYAAELKEIRQQGGC